MIVLQVFLKLHTKDPSGRAGSKGLCGVFLQDTLPRNSMPLKRFLTLHGEEFSKKHPAIFEIICRKLVWRLEVSLTIQTRRSY